MVVFVAVYRLGIPPAHGGEVAARLVVGPPLTVEKILEGVMDAHEASEEIQLAARAPLGSESPPSSSRTSINPRDAMPSFAPGLSSVILCTGAQTGVHGVARPA